MQNPYPEALPFIGQQRAQSALDFPEWNSGYNVYVMGEAAHGRYTLVKTNSQPILKTAQRLMNGCMLITMMTTVSQSRYLCKQVNQSS